MKALVISILLYGQKELNSSSSKASIINDAIGEYQIIQTVKPRCQGFASRIHHSKVLMKETKCKNFVSLALRVQGV